MSAIDFNNIDRRIIYVLVLIGLVLPLALKYTVPPARMKSAERLFNVVDKLESKPGQIAIVALDFGPSTVAENLPQSEVIVEHLLRKRIPVAMFSLYVQAEGFLDSMPEKIVNRLMKEDPTQKWEYGTDWINLGYSPGGFLIVQAVPKTEDLADLFKKDAKGNNLRDLPAFKGVKTLANISFLGEITSLVGMRETYIQFFQNKSYRPPMGHGCTSIAVPDAYIYLDSGQMVGLLEGIAGAAWYSKLLADQYPNRAIDDSQVINTGLGVAHLIVIILIILGNIAYFYSRRKEAIA